MTKIALSSRHIKTNHPLQKQLILSTDQGLFRLNYHYCTQCHGETCYSRCRRYSLHQINVFCDWIKFKRTKRIVCFCNFYICLREFSLTSKWVPSLNLPAHSIWKGVSRIEGYETKITRTYQVSTKRRGRHLFSESISSLTNLYLSLSLMKTIDERTMYNGRRTILN